jgi:membrane-associated protease RseP (regulator of RpoE activity)
VTEPISLRTRPYAGDLSRGYSQAPVQVRRERGPGFHIALFFATFLTTAMASALLQGRDVMTEPSAIVVGLPYAIGLMTILLFHESGHYILARLHRVEATLPFFIPAPPVIFLIGTLGAFIRMRTLPRDRRALFDVGAAGPWAGMLVAVPILFVGLLLSDVQPSGPDEVGGLFLGESLLFKWLSWLALGTTGDGVTIILHPLAIAGWVGFLVTALNLLPVGQLDGGHVVYAALGEKWHRWISRGTVVTLVVLGVGGAATWLVWAVLLSFLGVRHPRLLDSETELDRPRKWAAAATLVMFLLTFMPEPLRVAEPARQIPRDEHAVPVNVPSPLPLPQGWLVPT